MLVLGAGLESGSGFRAYCLGRIMVMVRDRDRARVRVRVRGRVRVGVQC